MKKFIILILLFCFQSVYATDITRIVNILSKIAEGNTSIQHLNMEEINELQDISKGLVGTHNYGSMYYDRSLYSWGNGADTWQGLLQSIATQYLENDHFHSPNDIENEYYRLQAQTTMASRSSSQQTFDQVARAARTIEHLQTEIDRAKDSKSAMDLNNRFSSEQASLHVQQTRLLATLVQQIAIDAQDKANRAREDASFFNYQ